MATSAAPVWYTTPRFRRLVLTLLAVVLVIQGYLAIFVRQNDILCHVHVGQAFLAGDPYGNGQEIYPVGRAMMNALLALAPIYPTRAVCYSLAVLGLVLCFVLWRRLAEQHSSASPEITAAAALGAVGLTFPFLLRDLDECGMQIFLLVFLTIAGYALIQNRAWSSGFWLATATMYKVTPMLFLPFLLWRRQWRAAAWMGVFVLLWALAPMLYLGVDMTLQSHARWWACSSRIAAARQAYPSQLEREEPKVYNVSFAAAVARYLETVPPDHPLYVHHAAFVQFGNLEPLTAYYVVRGAMLGLALVLAWRFWPRGQQLPVHVDMTCLWAAMCILCAILSPVCWKQHLVLIWPSVFLTLRRCLAQPQQSRVRLLLLGLAGAIFLLSRNFVVGKAFSEVLLSYKVDTLGVLLCLGLVLSLPARKSLAQLGSAPDAARTILTPAA